jgi:hypothetical protein
MNGYKRKEKFNHMTDMQYDIQKLTENLSAYNHQMQ